MKITGFIKHLLLYLLLAWVGPLAIVVVVKFFTPNPNQSRNDFPGKTFKPALVQIVKERGRKRSDSFELRIESPEGEVFFHRDPESEPITALERRLLKDSEVSVLYAPGPEGNGLLEIVSGTGPSAEKILAFESVMEEYASRRRLVYIIAAIWFGLANLIAFGLWRAIPASGNSG